MPKKQDQLHLFVEAMRKLGFTMTGMKVRMREARDINQFLKNLGTANKAAKQSRLHFGTGRQHAA